MGQRFGDGREWPTTVLFNGAERPWMGHLDTCVARTKGDAGVWGYEADG